MGETYTPDRADAPWRNWEPGAMTDPRDYVTALSKVASAKRFGKPVVDGVLDLIYLADGALRRRIVNRTGGTLTTKHAITIDGYDAGAQAWNAVLADVDDSLPAMGFPESDIADDASGEMVLHATVSADSSGETAGDILYLVSNGDGYGGGNVGIAPGAFTQVLGAVKVASASGVLLLNAWPVSGVLGGGGGGYDGTWISLGGTTDFIPDSFTNGSAYYADTDEPWMAVLPESSGITPGRWLRVVNSGNYALTVKCYNDVGVEYIYQGGSSTNTINVGPGECLTLISNGGNGWYVGAISVGGGGGVANPMTTDLDAGGWNIGSVDTIGADTGNFNHINANSLTMDGVIDCDGNNINNVNTITAGYFVGDGSGLTGLTGLTNPLVADLDADGYNIRFLSAIKDSGGNTVIDVQHFELFSTGLTKTLDWQHGDLVDPGDGTSKSLSWADRQLYAPGDVFSLDWYARKGFANDGTTQMFDYSYPYWFECTQPLHLPETGFASPPASGLSLFSSGNKLHVANDDYSDSTVALLERDQSFSGGASWDSYNGYSWNIHSGGSAWQVARDSNLVMRVTDGGVLEAYDSAVILSADFDARALKDSAGNTAITWGGAAEILYPGGGGNPLLNGYYGTMFDYSGNLSVDIPGRNLAYGGSTLLSWGSGLEFPLGGHFSDMMYADYNAQIKTGLYDGYFRVWDSAESNAFLMCYENDGAYSVDIAQNPATTLRFFSSTGGSSQMAYDADITAAELAVAFGLMAPMP